MEGTLHQTFRTMARLGTRDTHTEVQQLPNYLTDEQQKQLSLLNSFSSDYLPPDKMCLFYRKWRAATALFFVKPADWQKDSPELPFRALCDCLQACDDRTMLSPLFREHLPQQLLPAFTDPLHAGFSLVESLVQAPTLPGWLKGFPAEAPPFRLLQAFFRAGRKGPTKSYFLKKPPYLSPDDLRRMVLLGVAAEKMKASPPVCDRLTKELTKEQGNGTCSRGRKEWSSFSPASVSCASCRQPHLETNRLALAASRSRYDCLAHWGPGADLQDLCEAFEIAIANGDAGAAEMLGGSLRQAKWQQTLSPWRRFYQQLFTYAWQEGLTSCLALWPHQQLPTHPPHFWHDTAELYYETHRPAWEAIFSVIKKEVQASSEEEQAHATYRVTDAIFSCLYLLPFSDAAEALCAWPAKSTAELSKAIAATLIIRPVGRIRRLSISRYNGLGHTRSVHRSGKCSVPAAGVLLPTSRRKPGSQQPTRIKNLENPAIA